MKKNGTYTKKPLDFEQAKKIIESQPDPELKLFGAIAISCGTRVGEIIKMKLEDVKEGEVMIRKTKVRKGKPKYRTVPKSEWLTRIIDETMPHMKRKGSSLLFQSMRGGGPIDRAAANKRMRKIFEGVDVGDQIPTLHMTRKTAAKAIYDRGQKDIYLVKRFLDHENVNSSIRYVNASEEEFSSVYNKVFQ